MAFEARPPQALLSAPSIVSMCWNDHSGRAWGMSTASQILLSMDFAQLTERGAALSIPTHVADCGPGGHSLAWRILPIDYVVSSLVVSTHLAPSTLDFLGAVTEVVGGMFESQRLMAFDVSLGEFGLL